MKTITFAGGSIVTSGAVAQALLEYAAALARVELADAVAVPVVGSRGDADEANLLLGPASQFIVENTSAPEVVLDDQSALEYLSSRTAALGNARPQIVSEELERSADLDPDFYELD